MGDWEVVRLVPTKISVIIPARNEYPQLCWTIYSIINDMPAEYEAIVASNAATDETEKVNDWFLTTGLGKHRLLKIFRSVEPLNPFRAGTEALKQASGNVVLWADAHIAVQRGTIPKMLKLITRRGGLVHSPMLWMGDMPIPAEHKCFSYKDPLQRGWTFKHNHATRPYTVCGSGAGLMMATRSDWETVRGVDAPFKTGVGGGETLLDMKFWMFGMKVRVHPACLYWHWARTRGYTWTMGEFYWNQLCTFYILGGEELMQQNNAAFSYPQQPQLLDEVKEACSSHRKFILDNAKFTLDEVLEKQPWLTDAKM